MSTLCVAGKSKSNLSHQQISRQNADAIELRGSLCVAPHTGNLKLANDRLDKYEFLFAILAL